MRLQHSGTDNRNTNCLIFINSSSKLLLQKQGGQEPAPQFANEFSSQQEAGGSVFILFFLSTFFLLERAFLRQQKNPLAEDNFERGTFSVFKLANPFNIPTYLCAVKKADLLYPLIGSGTSLDPFVALYRAVTEAVQLNLLSQKQTIFEQYTKDDKRINDLVNELPHFAKIRNFDGDFQISEAEANLKPKLEKNIIDQKNWILDVFSSSGIEVYSRKIFSSKKTPICCTQVLIPSFSSFYLIEEGWLTNPKSLFKGG